MGLTVKKILSLSFAIALAVFYTCVYFGATVPESSYSLLILACDGLTEEITAAEIGLEAAPGSTPDARMLLGRLSALRCAVDSASAEPYMPAIIFSGDRFVLDETAPYGRIDMGRLFAATYAAIVNGAAELDADAAGCYEDPEYMPDDPRIAAALETLNRYVRAQIYYDFGSLRARISGTAIKDWIWLDRDYNIYFDETKAGAFLSELFRNYAEGGTEQLFMTTSGQLTSLADLSSETGAAAVSESGKVIRAVIQGVEYHADISPAENKIGNTYVEISLQAQHLWFYKSGALLAEGDVVTGNEAWGLATPRGIYRIYYKMPDAVLTGPDYACPVAFWMPFNGGIGLHDATWRSDFGGEIYKNDGSHGCINCPYWLAEALFWNIEPGTPVICY